VLAGQRGLNAFFHQPLPRPGNRIDARLQRRRDLLIAPASSHTRGVRFQQNAGLQKLLRRVLTGLNQSREMLTLRCAQLYDIPLYCDFLRDDEPDLSMWTALSNRKMTAKSMTEPTSHTGE
jgi:hypothetical protein